MCICAPFASVDEGLPLGGGLFVPAVAFKGLGKGDARGDVAWFISEADAQSRDGG